MGKKRRIISQPRHDRSSMSQARATPPLLSSRSGSLARQRRLKRRKSPITEARLSSANLGQRPSHEMNSWPVSKVSLHPERNGGPFNNQPATALSFRCAVEESLNVSGSEEEMSCPIQL